MSIGIDIDQDRLADFCQKWKIVELALFGSVLREDFGLESDVDFLATYLPEARWSLFDIMDAEEELAAIVGRKADLINRSVIERSENWIRRKAILNNAKTIHVAR